MGRKWEVQGTGWQSTYQSDVLNFLLFLKRKTLGKATSEPDLFWLKSLPAPHSSLNFSAAVCVQMKVCAEKKGKPASPIRASFYPVSQQKTLLHPFSLVASACHPTPLFVHQIYISKFPYCCRSLIIDLPPAPSVEAF